MTHESFDLREQPWIRVRALDGPVHEVSLQDAFERAHEFQGLAGEVVTQDFAVLRLLLAVLHRAVPWGAGDPVDDWGRAWAGDLDAAEAAVAHLARYAPRFDLLHPTTPFFQVAGLRTAKDGAAPLTTLIADVPNNEQFFTTRAGSGVRRMSLGEAARWLVHVQAYDPSGIKSGAVGDPRVKGGKGYPIGVAWAGELGGVLMEGSNLRETLLLNLVLADGEGKPWEADSAVWERPAHGPGVESTDRRPTGPADLLTWQSRRVRLRVDGSGGSPVVTGVLIANGDPNKPQNRHLLEPMTAWRRSSAQQKALKIPVVYMPRTHQPTRALWRGLPALLPHVETPEGVGQATEGLPVGTLEWLAVLAEHDVLAPDHPLRTRAVGVEYGSNSSVIAEVVDDTVLLHAVLLGQEGEALRAAAVQAVGVADRGAQALAALAGNLAAAGGGESDGPRDRAREQAYFALDAPFRRWLGSLRQGVDAQERRMVWEGCARDLLERLGRQLVEAAGSPAWTGRDVTRLGRTDHVDTALAEVWFVNALRKTFVLTSTPTPEKDAS